MPNAPRCGPAMDSRSCQVTQGVTVMEWLPGEVCAQPPPGPVQGHITVSSRPAPRVTWLLLAEQGGVGLWTHRALSGSWLAPGCAGPVGAALGAWLRGLHVTHSVSL